ncbi:tRNA (adenine(58)-N(1))-methyltransferase non-catalytic subunit TRM6 [Thelohanellus kitauei]|uniref:tRNA (adenine(58)-N(1))-methyltransferase non-catalytic subunit TRM6 n=1 Tax=Thelohanellus kitauei TaxID=669202 RepID=A0A0C2IF21_THEKT|nr:tRNA (adenine(58)-N(1))-methyltransferase non-catalytic subunit TRM6 [Thelohanellus kitauei]
MVFKLIFHFRTCRIQRRIRTVFLLMDEEVSNQIVEKCCTVQSGQNLIIECMESIYLIKADGLNAVKITSGVRVKGKDLVGARFGVRLTVNKKGEIEPTLLSHQAIAQDMSLGVAYGDGSQVTFKGDSVCLDNTVISQIKNHSESNMEVVKKIVGTNKSFGCKTKHSQHKYVMKKLKKHFPIFTLHPCDSYKLSKFYYRNYPDKICHLRPDRLAHILFHSAISQNSRVICFESTHGLVVGAILERLSSGKLLQFYTGSEEPHNKALKLLDISTVEHSMVNYSNIDSVFNEHQKTFESLIIVVNRHPLIIVKNLIRFLIPSSSIVIYSQIVEPLIEIYDYFRRASLGYDMYITESWLRNIKVQEESCHPEVTMNDRSGYLFKCFFIGS